MLNKIIRSFIILPICILCLTSSSKKPITVEGYVKIPDLYEDIYLDLKVTDCYINQMILLTIIVDNEVLIDKDEYITHYLEKKPIILPGFNKENQEKKVEIIIEYRNIITPKSYIDFILKGPSYSTINLSNNFDGFYMLSNPIGYELCIFSNQSEIFCEYESIILNVNQIVNDTSDRIIDLSSFYLKINSNIEYDYEYVEFKVFLKFENSDLICKDDEYVLLDIPLVRVSNNNFKFENEYAFFIDERNGNIVNNYNKYCNQYNVPFFIPFNIKDSQLIKYQVVIYDIGINHETIIYQSFIDFKEIDESLKYKQVNAILENVEYE